MNFLKIIAIFLSVTFLFACKPKLDQNSMFSGRGKMSKKKGHYDDGIRRNRPMSIQIAKDYDKLSKYDDNPKKAAKKAEKELAKKKRESQKARAKHNKKTRVKVKTTKGSPSGGGS